MRNLLALVDFEHRQSLQDIAFQQEPMSIHNQRGLPRDGGLSWPSPFSHHSPYLCTPYTCNGQPSLSQTCRGATLHALPLSLPPNDDEMMGLGVLERMLPVLHIYITPTQSPVKVLSDAPSSTIFSAYHPDRYRTLSNRKQWRSFAVPP